MMASSSGSTRTAWVQPLSLSRRRVPDQRFGPSTESTRQTLQSAATASRRKYLFRLGGGGGGGKLRPGACRSARSGSSCFCESYSAAAPIDSRAAPTGRPQPQKISAAASPSETWCHCGRPSLLQHRETAFLSALQIRCL
jgi:hypothetical protein